MADISKEIQKFKSAVYGEEVRGAMIDLANALNNESSAAKTEAESAKTKADSAEKTTNTFSEKQNELENNIVLLNGFPFKYEIEWVADSYVDSGKIIDYVGWHRSQFIELKNTNAIYVTTTQTSDNRYNSFFDANRNYISNLYITGNSDKAIIDYVPKNAKYVVVSCPNTVKIDVFPTVKSVDSIDKRVSALENDETAIPSYYNDNDYIQEKNRKVNTIMDSMTNCVSFVFFTDQHLYSNSMKSGYLMKNILGNTSVKDVINGGDVISAYGTEESILDDCEKYKKYWGFLNPYYVRGNHDNYAKATESAASGVVKGNSMVINRFMQPYHSDMVIDAGKTYYYFDRPQNKVRFICLDTTEIITENKSGSNWQPDFAITQAQVDWFIELLKNTPNGYKIIVCNHIPINSHLRWYSDFCLIFGDVIEAFNSKSSINKTNAEGITANADFSGTNGKVYLSICGHGHADYSYKSNSGCLYYEVNCDSRINNGGSPYARTDGTTTEQAFDVVMFDAATNLLKTVRYGAGIDTTTQL